MFLILVWNDKQSFYHYHFHNYHSTHFFVYIKFQSITSLFVLFYLFSISTHPVNGSTTIPCGVFRPVSTLSAVTDSEVFVDTRLIMPLLEIDCKRLTYVHVYKHIRHK